MVTEIEKWSENASPTKVNHFQRVTTCPCLPCFFGWLTYVTVIVSHQLIVLTEWQTEWQNDRSHHSANAGGVINSLNVIKQDTKLSLTGRACAKIVHHIRGKNVTLVSFTSLARTDPYELPCETRYLAQLVAVRYAGHTECLSHIEEAMVRYSYIHGYKSAFTHHESRSVCGCGDEGDPVGPISWDRSIVN